MNSPVDFIENKLAERRLAENYRSLKPKSGLVDFCSNDYLGFARSALLKSQVEAEIAGSGIIANGSTGSRLISGNSCYAEALEQQLAAIHGCEAALLFNSGYDANVGLFSSLPQRGDTVIIDELIHASVIDGIRLSYAAKFSFRHNDLNSLEAKLKHAKGICYVVIESVYSMDGDSPDINAIINLTNKYNAYLVVDEAHAIGLHGYGLIQGKMASRVFARIVTFGKALGCHGAAVLGSSGLKAYLINFARSFIYTTAPSLYNLAAVKMAYQMLGSADEEIQKLKNNISFFKHNLIEHSADGLVSSESAVQCILIKDNSKALSAAEKLQQAGLDVRAILSPTVAAGSERLRICIHSFNTEEDIMLLTQTLNKINNV